MAELGKAFRITLLEASAVRKTGLFGLGSRVKDEDVTLEWKAEVRYRSGAEWVQMVAAEGQMTGAEVRWWAGWFSQAGRIRNFPTQLGDAPTEPVARLWTPRAGSHVEFFAWPERLGGLVLMGLFTPDENAPEKRIAIETRVSDDDLEAFGDALEAEYEARLLEAGIH